MIKDLGLVDDENVKLSRKSLEGWRGRMGLGIAYSFDLEDVLRVAE